MRAGAAITALLAACGFSPTGAAAPTDPDAAGPAVDAPFPVGAPRAYWSFDVDARDVMGRHPGTLVGAAQITTDGSGRRGEALQLEGPGDRVDVGAPRDLDFNRDFTWHVYVRTTTSSGALFSRNPAGTAWNQGSKALFVRGRTVQWDSGWVSNPRTGVTIDDDAWHQVIATYVAATDTLDVFVDPQAGTTTGQYSGSHDVNKYDEHNHNHLNGVADTGFSIGAANFTGGLNDLGTLAGWIDEAAVFDRALQGPELDRLIAGGPAAFLE